MSSPYSSAPTWNVRYWAAAPLSSSGRMVISPAFPFEDRLAGSRRRPCRDGRLGSLAGSRRRPSRHGRPRPPLNAYGGASKLLETVRVRQPAAVVRRVAGPLARGAAGG